MVIRSTHDYDRYKQQVHEIISSRFGKDKAGKFMQHFQDRYDALGRSYIDYKLAFLLLDDYHYVKRIGTRWYAFVGVGGSGKSTLAKNVFYWLDGGFSLAHVTTEIDKFVRIIYELPRVGAMRSIFLDEPDDTIVTSSKKGKVLRKIFGKIRQQKLFIGICATDLKDIPPYIFRKLDGIFFCPYAGKFMFFKNRPNKQSYILQRIRQDYDKKGYQLFFELKNDKGCLRGDSHKGTPLDAQEEQYLKDKEADFESDIKEFLTMDKPDKPKPDRRDQAIISMKQKGLTDEKIGSLVGLTRRRVSQILSNWGIGRGRGLDINRDEDG